MILNSVCSQLLKVEADLRGSVKDNTAGSTVHYGTNTLKAQLKRVTFKEKRGGRVDQAADLK